MNWIYKDYKNEQQLVRHQKAKKDNHTAFLTIFGTTMTFLLPFALVAINNYIN